MLARPTRTAVFVSGSGTNLQALIDARLPLVDIVLVFSNNPGAYAIERARKHGIPVRVLDHRRFPSRTLYDKEVMAILEEFGVDLVVLAGYMRILSPMFVRAYRNRIMNIHPSLLPSFPGVHGVRDALRYGVKYTGCTVHFIDEGVDTGPIIAQAVVAVRDDDTEESLHRRIQAEEHRLYPEAVRMFSEGKLRVHGRRVYTA